MLCVVEFWRAMSQILTSLGLLKPPPRIRLKVDYYNAIEKEKFDKYPQFIPAKLKALTESEIEIPTSEFIASFLFHRNQPEGSGRFSRLNFEQKIVRALMAMEDQLVFSDNSIHAAADPAYVNTYVKEMLGEAIGLSVLRRVHGTTLADWSKIPHQTDHKTFDYSVRRAFSDSYGLEMEAKGTVITPCAGIHPNVSQQKYLVLQKKNDYRENQDRYVGPRVQVLRYGVIAAASTDIKETLQCFLVDPPGEEGLANPLVLRLLCRMRFLRDWVAYATQDSHFSTALSTRVIDLESIRDPFELNGVQLRYGGNLLFDVQPVLDSYGFDRYKRSGQLSKVARLTDGFAGGSLFELSRNAMCFVGVSEPLLKTAMLQDFEKILEFADTSTSQEKAVLCRMTRKKAYKLGLLEKDPKDTGAKLVSIQFRGLLHFVSEGIVFGVLPKASVSGLTLE